MQAAFDDKSTPTRAKYNMKGELPRLGQANREAPLCSMSARAAAQYRTRVSPHPLLWTGPQSSLHYLGH
jgi:hypothetical protein